MTVMNIDLIAVKNFLIKSNYSHKMILREDEPEIFTIDHWDNLSGKLTW